MVVSDRTGKRIKNGDIIDINETVNGESKFIIVDLDNLDVRYHREPKRKYEYDVKELLGVHNKFGFIDTEIEIVGLINNEYLNELREVKSKIDLKVLEERLDKQLGCETKESLSKWLKEKRLIDTNKTKEEILDEYGLYERHHSGFDKVVVLKENEYTILTRDKTSHKWSFWNTEDISYEQYIVLKKLYDIKVEENRDEYSKSFVVIEPNELEPVLAEIQHRNDLGLSKWYEVVYFDGESWCSYSGSKTFKDGEKVIKWKYCNDCF